LISPIADEIAAPYWKGVSTFSTTMPQIRPVPELVLTNEVRCNDAPASLHALSGGWTSAELAGFARTACELYVNTHQFVLGHNFIFGSLSGMCGLASLVLRDLVVEAGRVAEVVRGKVGRTNHGWVESEGVVYDITYGQFDWTNPVWIALPENSPHVRRVVYRGISSFVFWSREIVPTKTSLQWILARSRERMATQNAASTDAMPIPVSIAA
jgi:hypothetical protein